MKSQIVRGVLGIVLAGWAATASATLLNIEINGRSASSQSTTDYSGAAAIGAIGDVWNHYAVDSFAGDTFLAVDPAQSSNLAYADGTSSTLRFDLGLVTAHAETYTSNALASEYAFVKGGNVAWEIPPTSTTFALTGLAPNGAYNLYLYCASAETAYQSTFTIGSTSVTSTPGGFDGGFVLNRDYVTFMNVAADGSGRIEGTLSGGNPDNFAVFSGLQVMSIPEPSALVLLLVSMMGLLAYAWRRRRSSAA